MRKLSNIYENKIFNLKIKHELLLQLDENDESYALKSKILFYNGFTSRKSFKINCEFIPHNVFLFIYFYLFLLLYKLLIFFTCVLYYSYCMYFFSFYVYYIAEVIIYTIKLYM
jgi:hypothetical protein